MRHDELRRVNFSKPNKQLEIFELAGKIEYDPAYDYKVARRRKLSWDIYNSDWDSMRRAYLDNNATTPVLPEVLAAMQPYFLEEFGNASSIHHHGQHTRAAVESARENVAQLLGARASEIVFTSGGTEADNLALFGLAKPGDHVITSTIEHHAVLNACKRLEETGCEVTYVPVDGQALVNPDDVKRALRPNTKLISIMAANNETGVVQRIAEIGAIAAEADVYFHTDAVQAAGKIPINVAEWKCDLLSISGHKIHAPQGIGALYVRKGTLLQPLFYGGRHERSRRAGTENVPGIVGLGQSGGDRNQRVQRWQCGAHRRVARPNRIVCNGIDRAGWREQRRRSARAEHDQHLLRLHRRRGDGDRARPEGRCGFNRRGVFFGRH